MDNKVLLLILGIMTATELSLAVILQKTYDIVALIISYDFIGLSWMILCLYVGVSLLIGWKYYLVSKGQKVRTEFDWFHADSTTRWGMFGTILGVMYVLVNAFPSITGDFALDKEILITATEGIGTALITTGIGMACDYLLSIKLMVLDMYNEKIQTDE